MTGPAPSLLRRMADELTAYGGDVEYRPQHPSATFNEEVRFRTRLYEYKISGRFHARANRDDYLGCVAYSRTGALPRDRIVADGRYTPETWDRILKGIVALELCKPAAERDPAQPMPRQVSALTH